MRRGQPMPGRLARDPAVRRRSRSTSPRPPPPRPSPTRPLRGNRDFWVVLWARGSARSATRSRTPPCRSSCSPSPARASRWASSASSRRCPDLVVGLPAGAYADRWDRRKMMFVGRPRAGRPDRPDPDLRLAGRADPGPDPARDLPDERAPGALAGGLHGGRARASSGAARSPAPTPSSRPSSTSAGSSGRPWPACSAATIGPGRTIAIDAITFALSAAALLFVRRPLQPEARTEPTHLLADIREGIAFVARQPTLRAVDRPVDHDLGDLRGPDERPHLLHHDRPRPRHRRRRPRALGVRRGVARRLARGRPDGVPQPSAR